MTIDKLKSDIENHSYKEKVLILKYEDNTFIANQYINELKYKYKEIVYVEGFKNCPNNKDDFFGLIRNDILYVIKQDKFDLDVEDLDGYSNIIVVCKSIGKTKDKVSKYIVEIPKLESWQIESYIQFKCKGLSNETCEKLISMSNGDIFRIDNEISKLSLFDDKDQERIFELIVKEGGFSDLTQYNIFNLTNAILKKDRETIKAILYDISNIDVEGVGLATILHRNFKQLVDVQTSRSATPESLGLTQKQFYAIKYNNNFSSKELIKILEFISSIDYELKSGNIIFNNERFIDYIIYKVLG